MVQIVSKIFDSKVKFIYLLYFCQVHVLILSESVEENKTCVQNPLTQYKKKKIPLPQRKALNLTYCLDKLLKS